ncbi:nucleotidyl transferase AbiEii/AbiGii toxin family protein [Fundidesulfovibrio soli]|uniref:nucleotidyl transferase AbiEii/AbiGii toxin family protein n=1 Tax=Fundidesulfovibrio soli TaxID=2922716 RepID=UPI001FAFD4AE|nr:nucleotidyl transferase AbiEii/AbiGii toxin family protein [Fundidesulfovibrio soli]
MQLDYEGLFKALSEAGIRYLLTGGVAVNFHGLPRMTFDVDLIVLFERDNLERLTTLLEGLGYVPRLPVPAAGLADEATREQWKRDKGLLAYTFMHPSQPMAEVDVMIDTPAPFEELAARGMNVPFGSTTVPLISREDLIATKLGSPRRQDICDVEALRKLEGGS